MGETSDRGKASKPWYKEARGKACGSTVVRATCGFWVRDSAGQEQTSCGRLGAPCGLIYVCPHVFAHICALMCVRVSPPRVLFRMRIFKNAGGSRESTVLLLTKTAVDTP